RNCRCRFRRRYSAKPLRRAHSTQQRKRSPPARRHSRLSGRPRRAHTVSEGSASAATAGAIAAPRGTSWRARTREARFALLLLVPSVIVVFGIVIYPILKTLYTSF